VESLVRIVVIIFLTIISLGVIALGVIKRPPRNIFLRIVFGALTTIGALSGLWLAMLQIGIVARLIGVAVAAASIKALFAVGRRSTTSEK